MVWQYLFAPRRFKMLSANKIIRYVKKQVQIKKDLDSPVLLIHFITSECNLKCNHCFYWKEIGKKEKLNLDNTAKIVSSLKPLDTVIITGGEPFLNPRLVSICRLYAQKSQNIHITTNGSLPSIIFDRVVEILEKTKSNIHLQVSLDALKECHDTLRGVKGSFDNAVKTIKKLKTIKNHRFSINVLTTISNYNYKELDKISEFVHRLGVEHAFEIIRSTKFVNNRELCDFTPKSKECTLPPLEEFESIYAKLKKNYKKYHAKKGYLDRQYIALFSKLRLSINILKMKKKLVDCPAGNLIGVIYPNGGVSVCEFFPQKANLKDFNYNFYKLWNSEIIRKERTKAKDCFCIHGCFLHPAVFYSTKTYLGFIIKNLIGAL